MNNVMLRSLTAQLNELITRPGAHATIVTDALPNGRECLKLTAFLPDDESGPRFDSVTLCSVPDDEMWIGVLARQTVGMKRVWTGMWAKDTVVFVPDIIQAVALRYGAETPQE